MQPWSDSLQRRVAALVFQRGQKIKIPDFFVLLLDSRQGDLIYPEVHFPWIIEYGLHFPLIQLRIQAAAAVEYRSQGYHITHSIIEDAPVSIVSIPIADQGVYNEHIPKPFFQLLGIYGRLLMDGEQNIVQLCPVSVPLRINHLVFH